MAATAAEVRGWVCVRLPRRGGCAGLRRAAPLARSSSRAVWPLLWQRALHRSSQRALGAAGNRCLLIMLQQRKKVMPAAKYQ